MKIYPQRPQGIVEKSGPKQLKPIAGCGLKNTLRRWFPLPIYVGMQNSGIRRFAEVTSRKSYALNKAVRNVSGDLIRLTEDDIIFIVKGA